MAPQMVQQTMNYHTCDWCNTTFDLGTPYILVDDYLRCCADCWNNYGIRELIELHGDDYEVVED